MDFITFIHLPYTGELDDKLKARLPMPSSLDLLWWQMLFSVRVLLGPPDIALRAFSE